MAESNIIGRKNEKKMLKEVLQSKEAEFLAVYGRRRVGKTHLIREYFSEKGVYFEMTGQKDGVLKDQLENFAESFSNTFYQGMSLTRPKSWKKAFEMLTEQIKKSPKNKKFIIFLDELPWLSTKRSKMLQALDYFWNRYWSGCQNLLLVVCGSAASWMLDNLINAKGGLYNRVTKTILLKPYNLKGTQEFLRHRGIHLNQKQVLDVYMVFGGIPFYLRQVTKGKSAAQIINDVCFQQRGLLYNEFDRLFHSLFNHAEANRAIIQLCAKQRSGISRDELTKKSKISSGGRLNKRLEELKASGLLEEYVPYGNKKKMRFYRVSDEYSYFYLNWIAQLKQRGVEGGKDYWQKKAKTPAVMAWSGYAFESVCLKHIDQIQEALGLRSLACEVGSWRFIPGKGSKEVGAQIDLLFDREDGVITLCEMKYSDNIFVLDKAYCKVLSNKIDVFEKNFPTSKQIFFTMVTLKGVKHSVWSEEVVQDEINLDDLFRS